jgi:hypothetical protein
MFLPQVAFFSPAFVLALLLEDVVAEVATEAVAELSSATPPQAASTAAAETAHRAPTPTGRARGDFIGRSLFAIFREL